MTADKTRQPRPRAIGRRVSPHAVFEGLARLISLSVHFRSTLLPKAASAHNPSMCASQCPLATDLVAAQKVRVHAAAARDRLRSAIT